MSGTIGLTKAGVILDKILTEENPPYKVKVYRFIYTFTNRCHTIRKELTNDSVRSYVLEVVRQDHLQRINSLLKDIISYKVYTHLCNYVHTLTKENFIPNTRTQESLMRKKHKTSPY
jgi:hypothetical protein